MTQLALGTQAVARHFGDDNEIGPAHRNDPCEHRMDMWNNEVGRRIGDDVSGRDALAAGCWSALQKGNLITDLSDARLRQLYPSDQRLQLPANDPQREMLDKPAVDRINTDVQQQLGNREPTFDTNNRDDPLYAALRERLPESVDDDKVAETMLRARQGGIDRADQLACVTIQNDRIFVMGAIPGRRGFSEISTPTPPLVDTLAQADALQARTPAIDETRRQPQVMSA